MELIFKSDLVVNVVHALVSAIFITSVFSVRLDGTLVQVTVGGMFESVVSFDSTSDRIYETYFSNILGSLNVASATSSSASDKPKPNKRKSFSKSASAGGGSPLMYDSTSSASAASGSPLGSKFKGESPSGVRSFSSVNRSSDLYAIEYIRDGIEYKLYFPSYDKMKLFFNQEIKVLK